MACSPITPTAIHVHQRVFELFHHFLPVITKLTFWIMLRFVSHGLDKKCVCVYYMKYTLSTLRPQQKSCLTNKVQTSVSNKKKHYSVQWKSVLLFNFNGILRPNAMRIQYNDTHLISFSTVCSLLTKPTVLNAFWGLYFDIILCAYVPLNTRRCERGITCSFASSCTWMV